MAKSYGWCFSSVWGPMHRSKFVKKLHVMVIFASQNEEKCVWAAHLCSLVYKERELQRKKKK